MQSGVASEVNLEGASSTGEFLQSRAQFPKEQGAGVWGGGGVWPTGVSSWSRRCHLGGMFRAAVIGSGRRLPGSRFSLTTCCCEPWREPRVPEQSVVGRVLGQRLQGVASPTTPLVLL